MRFIVIVVTVNWKNDVLNLGSASKLVKLLLFCFSRKVSKSFYKQLSEHKRKNKCLNNNFRVSYQYLFFLVVHKIPIGWLVYFRRSCKEEFKSAFQPLIYVNSNREVNKGY